MNAVVCRGRYDSIACVLIYIQWRQRCWMIASRNIERRRRPTLATWPATSPQVQWGLGRRRVHGTYALDKVKRSTSHSSTSSRRQWRALASRVWRWRTPAITWVWCETDLEGGTALPRARVNHARELSSSQHQTPSALSSLFAVSMFDQHITRRNFSSTTTVCQHSQSHFYRATLCYSAARAVVAFFFTFYSIYT